MMPLVTIYMPTRNRRTLVERAVRSVLRQDHTAIELIVVDDASTDDTRAYLDEVAATDARVRVIHMAKPGGAPAARNRAIAMAQGEFTTGLDDDDEFEATRLSTFVAAWSRHVAAATTPACLFTGTRSVHGATSVVTSGQLPRVGYLDLFMKNEIGNQVFAPTAHFRGVDGFDEAMPAWQDLELFIRMLRRFGSALLVDAPTYIAHITVGLERISADPRKVRRAFERISAKYPDVSPAYHDALYLQMFSQHYGTVPSLEDFTYLLRRRAFGAAGRLTSMALLNGRRKTKSAVLGMVRR